MKLDKGKEEEIKAIAIRHLKEGKPEWDVPHTLASVDWMRKLIEREGGNEKVLVTAMYLHDIGYPKLRKDLCECALRINPTNPSQIIKISRDFHFQGSMGSCESIYISSAQ